MSMHNDDLDRETAEHARRVVADAHEKRAADQPILIEADQVAARLRALRTENHWATRVRATWKESRAT